VSYTACREPLECALYCEAPDCEVTCVDTSDGEGAQAVLDCGAVHCGKDVELGACLSTHCFDALHACYFSGQSGASTCAETWTCFGDCGDDAVCLDVCRHAASLQAQALFLAVEICSDEYVITQCRVPSETCDIQAFEVICADELSACLQDGMPPVSAEVESLCAGACEHLFVASDCQERVGRVMAGCPTVDKLALQAREHCLSRAGCDRHGIEQCPAFQPSALCIEILGAGFEAGGFP